MRLLLDTHALLWWFFDDPRLSETARSHIKDPDNDVLVSSASAWEISTKYRLGKLPEATEAVERFQELIGKSRMEPLPITVAHALLAGGLSASHKDPFDRMLAAQARLEGVPLVTSDQAFTEFGVDILW